MYCQDVTLKVVEGDTIVAVPIKYLPVINSTFEENDWLKNELELKDSLGVVNSIIIQEKDKQLEAWRRRDNLWEKKLNEERSSKKKAAIWTGIGAGIIGIILGILIR